MTVTRRTLLASLAAAPAATLMSRSAFAAYPERAIHLIVPFAAGGNADIVGRIVGDVISKAVKQPSIRLPTRSSCSPASSTPHAAS